jgi:hypothetical protein
MLQEGRVTFTTTLFALIRDNLKINVRESAEMDQVRNKFKMVNLI